MRQLQKKIKSGTLNIKQDDPFELFVAATNIRYCYYNETHKILGNTFGMCVLQVRVSFPMRVKYSKDEGSHVSTPNPKHCYWNYLKRKLGYSPYKSFFLHLTGDNRK